MRRVVILGRGGAGKSALSRQLSDATRIPAVELDALFWQPGPVPIDKSRWAGRQHDLVQRASWILDGDLGPYDEALDVRLRAADTIVVLDFTFPRCAWRTLRRGREQAEYWRWVWAYRRRSLPAIMRAISADAPDARLYVLRSPAMVRRFVDEARRQPRMDAAADSGLSRWPTPRWQLTTGDNHPGHLVTVILAGADHCPCSALCTGDN